MATPIGKAARPEPSPLRHAKHLGWPLSEPWSFGDSQRAYSVQTARPQLVFRNRQHFAREPQTGARYDRARARLRPSTVQARHRRWQNRLVVAAAHVDCAEIAENPVAVQSYSRWQPQLNR